jgi:hypothetical protein
VDGNTAFSIYPFPPAGHLANEGHGTHTMKYHQHKSEIENSNANLTKSIDYPTYKLIICCNYIGYLPMLILQLSESL